MSKSIENNEFNVSINTRQMTFEDIDDVITLQEKCFPGMEPWERGHLESHLRMFPRGQIVVEFEGKIIGSCSSLIINFDEYDDRHTWDSITNNGYITNHNDHGHNLYGIEVMVDPEYRGVKVGARLYEARREIAYELNLKSIIIGGRIPNYHEYSDEMTPREYVQNVIKHRIKDPVLTFQLMNDFTLMRINPNYLNDDVKSMKYATLMEWNNPDYIARSNVHFKTSEPVRICTVNYMMRKINSFEEFANQIEYFIDVAYDADSDFIVFPELLTTQLMSFDEQSNPAESIRKLTTYTSQYIDMFNSLR